MKIFINKDIKQLFLAVATIMAVFVLASQITFSVVFKKFSLPLAVLSLLALVGVMSVCYIYFSKQNKIMESAVTAINAYLAGDTNARIACDSEGELYRLFHSVNSLAAILNAHAENEFRAREFLKGTISDISHQLKTPLAALNIYNGLLQNEAEDLPAIKEFAALSEQELDRIEILVQNLLKITKLDAGSIVIETAPENIADMMNDVESHFAYRAKMEDKEIILSGSDTATLICDRDWLIEAISNLVKNALDHTKAGDRIQIEWKQAAGLTKIIIKDNGTGIHPEDIHHIFKRFYRSRFSQDTQGLGLGLPLAKAIVEVHEGNIAVDSDWGKGSIFSLSFVNPTKLSD